MILSSAEEEQRVAGVTTPHRAPGSATKAATPREGDTDVRDVPGPRASRPDGQAPALALPLPGRGCTAHRDPGPAVSSRQHGQRRAPVSLPVRALPVLLQHRRYLPEALEI